MNEELAIALKEYLKENLSLEIKEDSREGCGFWYTDFRVILKIDGEVISEQTFTVYDRDSE